MNESKSKITQNNLKSTKIGENSSKFAKMNPVNQNSEKAVTKM